jgi:hypothetical protein
MCVTPDRAALVRVWPLAPSRVVLRLVSSRRFNFSHGMHEIEQELASCMLYTRTVAALQTEAFLAHSPF